MSTNWDSPRCATPPTTINTPRTPMTTASLQVEGSKTLGCWVTRRISTFAEIAIATMLDPIQRGAIGASVGRDNGRRTRYGRVQRLRRSAGLLLTLRARVYQAGCKAEDTRRRGRATSRGGPSRLGSGSGRQAGRGSERIGRNVYKRAKETNTSVRDYIYYAT